MNGVQGIPEPEQGAAEWLALEQAICHEAEEDKTIVTATNQIVIWPGTGPSSSKQALWKWGAKRKQEWSLLKKEEKV